MRKTFQKGSITEELAFTMIRVAEKKAKKIGISIATAIVDESGILKAFGRMDGAPLMAVSGSKKKAITASGGLATGNGWYNFIKDDPILMYGMQNVDDFLLLGGGLPIKIGGVVIGGIGVSGGHYKQSEACASSALEMLNSKLSRFRSTKKNKRSAKR